MKFIEKLNYLQDNHFNEWLNKRAEVKNEISNGQGLLCVCGRLATGLHEMGCRKFADKVTRETVRQLEHLIKKI